MHHYIKQVFAAVALGSGNGPIAWPILIRYRSRRLAILNGTWSLGQKLIVEINDGFRSCRARDQGTRRKFIQWFITGWQGYLDLHDRNGKLSHCEMFKLSQSKQRSAPSSCGKVQSCAASSSSRGRNWPSFGVINGQVDSCVLSSP